MRLHTHDKDQTDPCVLFRWHMTRGRSVEGGWARTSYHKRHARAHVRLHWSRTFVAQARTLQAATRYDARLPIGRLPPDYVAVVKRAHGFRAGNGYPARSSVVADSLKSRPCRRRSTTNASTSRPRALANITLACVTLGPGARHARLPSKSWLRGWVVDARRWAVAHLFVAPCAEAL